MKTCTRIGSLLLALGFAGLLAGCASQSATASRRPLPARDFEIVETSTKRLLTSAEMDQLRTMVGDYLEKQGETDSGDYYVKVYLPSEQVGAPDDWVVVRYSLGASTSTGLLTSTYAYDSYSPYYYYDYYPFAPFGFNQFSLQYYDYPFSYYGYTGYYPRAPYVGLYGHRRDGDRNKDNNRDHDPGDGRHNTSYPSPGYHPSPRDPQRVTHTRWDGRYPDNNSQPRDGVLPNRNDAASHWRPRVASENDYTPVTPGTPRRVYSPPTSSGNPGQPGRAATGQPGQESRHNDRTPHDDRASNRQDYGGRSHDSRPGNASPARVNQNTSRPVQAPTYSPPPARSDPTPASNQSSTRSDSSSQQDRRMQFVEGGRSRAGE